MLLEQWLHQRKILTPFSQHARKISSQFTADLNVKGKIISILDITFTVGNTIVSLIGYQKAIKIKKYNELDFIELRIFVY